MSTYYEYQDVKNMIAHKLMKMDGWRVYGYSADQSDSMTGYYCPAHWGGVAEKNGYILCVDVYGASKAEEIRKYNYNGFSYDTSITEKIQKLKQMTVERGASEQEEESAKKMIERLYKKAELVTENKEKYTVIGMIPGHMAHPSRCNWHIEKDGIIIAKGNGILKYAEVDSYYRYEHYIKDYQEFKNLGEDAWEKENAKYLLNHSYHYETKEEATKGAKCNRERLEKDSILIEDFERFINKLDTTCGGLLGEGDGTVYEKVTVTKYKKELKPVEVENGNIKEGQCFILKTNFNYGRFSGLVYKIHETEYDGKKSYHAYKLNGKYTKECTGNASRNNYWFIGSSEGENFSKWISKGAIAWCELKEVKTAYEVEQVTKKAVKSKNNTSAKDPVKQEEILGNSTEYTYEILKDTDTRDNSEIWVVKVKESLSREEYKDLKKIMGDIGGYYSRFKHGFIFKENPEELLHGEKNKVSDGIQEDKRKKEKQSQKENSSIEFDIIEDKSPSGKIIYLVKVKNELSKEEFSRVKQRFAKIQGYHSSLKDGFIFKYDPKEKLTI